MIRGMVEFELEQKEIDWLKSNGATQEDVNWLQSTGATIGWKPQNFIEVKNSLKDEEITPEMRRELRQNQITNIKQGLERFPYINSEADLYFKALEIPDDEKNSHPLMFFARSTATARVSGILSTVDLFKLFAREKNY